MADIHIWTAPTQPATDWTDYNFDPPVKGGFRPHQRFYCDTCGARREARNLTVKLYYDITHFFCKEGHERPGNDGRRKLVHK